MNLLPLRRLGFIAAVGLLLLAAQPLVSGAEPKLIPIGSFVKTRNYGDDETHGHQIMLWHDGSQLVGELIYWDYNPEGQAGDFTDGVYDAKTGTVRFRVTVIRHDTVDQERSTASFSGRIEGNVLTGVLQWEGEAAKWRGQAGLERLQLRRDRTLRLLRLSTIRAWQAAPVDRYEPLR